MIKRFTQELIKNGAVVLGFIVVAFIGMHLGELVAREFDGNNNLSFTVYLVSVGTVITVVYSYMTAVKYNEKPRKKRKR